MPRGHMNACTIHPLREAALTELLAEESLRRQANTESPGACQIAQPMKSNSVILLESLRANWKIHEKSCTCLQQKMLAGIAVGVVSFMFLWVARAACFLFIWERYRFG